jgi:hypothetical protein
MNRHTALFFATLVNTPLFAAEITEGTVLSASNIDALQSSTLEGHPLSELLTAKQAWMIREKGFTMTLEKSRELPIDPLMQKTTERFQGQAKIDSENNRLMNYSAGIPFPEIDPKDPLAGQKAVWNAYYGNPIWNSSSTEIMFFIANMDRGFERSNRWLYRRLYLSARVGEEQTSLDNNTQFYRQFLYATYPEDIRGVGTLTFRYMDGRMDDIYGYIKTVRRVRRLSGGAWMDPVGGTDLLQDEPWILSGFPGWYQNIKMTAKRMMLVPFGKEGDTWYKPGGSLKEQFPFLETEKKPYGTPRGYWMPREVYEVEVNPPRDHPYSKKVWYIDTKHPVFHFAENYDKAGHLWKIQYLVRFFKKYPSPYGEVIMGPLQGDVLLNYKDNHATIVCFDVPAFHFNDPKEKPADYAPTVLQDIAAGRR